jgi:uncharacterized protein (TIGR02001 family)
MMRLKSARAFTFYVLTLFGVNPSLAQTTSSNSSEMPKAKIFGQTSILTNFVVNGLSASDSQPAVQGRVGAAFGNFKAGFFASSVRYNNSNETILVEGFGEYLFVMTSNFNLLAHYGLTRYSPNGIRNGSIKRLDFSAFNYHFVFESTENYEATGYDQTHFGSHHEFDVAPKLKWFLGAGYNATDATGLANYFDAKTGLFFTQDEFKAELSFVLTSYSPGTNSRAGPFVLLAAHAIFN